MFGRGYHLKGVTPDRLKAGLQRVQKIRNRLESPQPLESRVSLSRRSNVSSRAGFSGMRQIFLSTKRNFRTRAQRSGARARARKSGAERIVLRF